MRNLIVLLTLLVSSQAFADTTKRDSIANWIERNMLNRTVVSSSTSYRDGGSIFIESNVKRTYGDLQRTENGLTFRNFNVIQQTISDVVDGQIVRPGRDTSRVQLHECSVRQVAFDAARLVGYCRALSVSGTDATGSVETATVSLEDDRLVIHYIPSIPAECFAAGGTYRPCNSESRMVFSVEAGKLKATASGTSYMLDPVTWARVDAGTTFGSTAIEP